MKIIGINIDSFGKLKSVGIKLTPGLNVVYGENGSGKSTLMRFIKASFYGFDRKERANCIPWDGTRAYGSVIYELKGREFLCSCKFGKTAKGDKCTVTDNLSGETVCEDFCGADVFGMGAASFSKTAFISCGSVIEPKGDDEIAEKLSNLKTSGDDAVSYASVSSDVESAMAKLIAKRGRNGRITQLEAAVAETKSELSRAVENFGDAEAAKKLLDDSYIMKESLEEKITLLKRSVEAEKFFRLKHLKDSIEKIGDVHEETGAGDMAVKIRRLREETEKLRFALENSESEKHEYTEIPDSDFNDAAAVYYGKEGKNPFFIVFSVLAVGFAVLGFFNPYFLFGTLLFSAAALLKRKKSNKDELVKKIAEKYGFSDFENFKNAYMNCRAEKAKAEERVKLRSETSEKLKKILEELNFTESEAFEKYGESDPCKLEELLKSSAALSAEKSAYEKSYKTLLGDDDFEELERLYGDVRTVSDSSVELEESLHKLSVINEKISKLERQNGMFEAACVPPCEIERRRDELADKLEKLKSDYRVLEIVNGVLTEAYAVMEGEFGGKLNDTAGEILERITKDYSSVRMNKKYTVRLAEEGEVRDASSFSSGLFEQIYLSFRLAMISLMGNDCPVFLDDSLMTYDDNRAKRTLEYLASCGRQVILFACRSRDAEAAAELGANVINI